MDFFDKANIKDIRLRSFFQLFEEDGEIRSEGSYSIRILNIGLDGAILQDVSGNSWRMEGGFPFEFNSLNLEGHPGIIRDDIIKITFDNVDPDQRIQVIYNRFVNKGDDINYPGQ